MPAAVSERTDAAGAGGSPVQPWALALRRLLVLAALGAGATIGCLLLSDAAHAHSGGSSPSVPGVGLAVRVPPLPSGVTRAAGHATHRAAPPAAGPSRPAGRSQHATSRPLPVQLYGSPAIVPPSPVRSVMAPLTSVVRPVVNPVLGSPVLGSPVLGLGTPVVGPVLAPVAGPVLGPLAPAVGSVSPTTARVGNSPALTAGVGGRWRSDVAGTAPIWTGTSPVTAGLPVDPSTVPRAPVAPALPPPLESAGAGNAPAAPAATGWLGRGSFRPHSSSSRLPRRADDRLSTRASRPGTRPD
jgi:hypothetical protein